MSDSDLNQMEPLLVRVEILKYELKYRKNIVRLQGE